ncbi:hypothetical protein MVEN_00696200 [Mycena venus]|uniref:CxC1-like cysteine cluster associated with KDZ transposases domain-containing protein n=1 Tax=Mycena venus TaxID=2733690 RepID=A0A8H6YJ82_9AGAR|nr:hypothetical protein MVEN_00696200 [Mycena venus]
MTREQCLARDRLRDMAEFDDDYGGGGGGDYEDDVLYGHAAADLSHAGEDFTRQDLVREDQAPYDRLMESHRALFGRRYDPRTCRDRAQKQSVATAEDGLGSLYELPADAVVQETRNVLIVDVFFPHRGRDPLRAGDLLRPTPSLGIQPFVQALCDVHGVAPRPWLASQFSVAFDIYLAIRAIVDRRVQVALGRHMPNWRLKNACPACLYKLEGEPRLHLPFLCTMDGNNSLSQYEIHEREEIHDDGTTAPGAPKELRDDHVAPGHYYLSREEVDRWAKEGLEDVMKGFAEDDEEDGCAERWQNMKEDVTARAWGMYDETGIFPALCRHGFVLVIVDMVKSGELTKYGFAVTANLFRVLGEVASGYNIRCKFGKMVNSHLHLRQLALTNGLKSLVGAFHGHWHNCCCQLGYYVRSIRR